MIRLSVIISFLFRKVLWMLLLVACDTYDGDEVDSTKEVIFGDTKFYVLPGSSIVIDLRSLVEHSFVGGSLSISRQPLRGTLTQLNSYLVKYSPAPDFVKGEDEFLVSILFDDRSTIMTEKLYVLMENSTNAFPCDVYAIEDLGRAKPNEVTIIKPMLNDRFCGVDGPLNISLYLKPGLGEAEVVGDSIIYRAGPTFQGSDEVVYRLSNGNNEDVAFGIVTFEDIRIETLMLPSDFREMFFVNENVGFVAEGMSIMRTVDGGKHWDRLNLPEEEWAYGYINELFFLDENIGFAAISAEIDWCWGGYGAPGWMMTTNGGVTWKRTVIGVPVESIFFTSPSRGFIGTTYISQVGEDASSLIWTHEILRTIDSGETWDKVAEYKTKSSRLSIRFANEKVGYAFCADKIFVTTDGGESWTQSFTNEYVGSLAVSGESVACAAINVNALNPTYKPRPATISRCEDGKTWTNVTSFPYSIHQIGFSPSGDLGLAIGVAKMDPLPELYELAVNMSTDKGKTWTNLSNDVQGVPLAISIPSANAAFLLCSNKILKFIP